MCPTSVSKKEMCPTSVFKKEMCPTSVFKKEMCPTSVFQKEMCPTSAKVRFWDKRVLFFSCPKNFLNLGSFFEKKMYTKKTAIKGTVFFYFPGKVDFCDIFDQIEWVSKNTVFFLSNTGNKKIQTFEMSEWVRRKLFQEKKMQGKKNTDLGKKNTT